MVPLRHAFLVLLLAVPLFACADQVTPNHEKAQLTELPNGIRLLVLPQPDKPLVQVDVYLSLRGATRNGGMAHLVEHLMFRSSENCPAGSLRDSLQLLATYYQGTTSTRNVHTVTRCIPRFLPRLLAVEAERFGRLRPDEADLEHEKKRVLGEHDFRKETYTWNALDLRILAMAYEEEGSGDPILGSPEVIKSVSLADVDTFISQSFHPERIVVLVRGPVDAEEVLTAAESSFGTIPAASPVSTPSQLPPRPDPRHYVTSSDDEVDKLSVGFRLPYKTSEDAAIVHLTEMIMDRENGRPHLHIFEDEALLIIHVWADFSTDHSNEEAADLAAQQFWEETLRVKHRVRDNWVFERNRKAHVDDLKTRVSKPWRHASWRAQRLADDRDLPDPGTLAAMVDTLDQEKIRTFFAEQFTESRAFTAFAAGRAPDDAYLMFRNRGIRLWINPYLARTSRSSELGVADITPILKQAASLDVGRIQAGELDNGIPFHVLDIPGAEDIYLGGVRTFSYPEDEALGPYPLRLSLYEWLANHGYDYNGSIIAPVGNRLGWHTRTEVTANSLAITAHGPADDFEDVAAAMHKRIKVGKLNPYAFRWYVDTRQDWVDQNLSFAPFRAWCWRLETVFGKDHPMSGWATIDMDCYSDWSIKEANKLHWVLGKTGNFQMVAAGDTDLSVVRETLSADFGKRRPAVPGVFPVTGREGLIVEGGVVHDDSSTVALISFLFPSRPLADDPALKMVDIPVLENLFESRLRLAAESADLDSVSVWVNSKAVGHSVLPWVSVIARPADAEQMLGIVKKEIVLLANELPTFDEEARARLQLMGPLLEILMDAEKSRDFLLEYGLFGETPTNPLEHLLDREYGVITPRGGGLFPPGQYAWTVTGDTTLVSIRKLGPVLR